VCILRAIRVTFNVMRFPRETRPKRRANFCFTKMSEKKADFFLQLIAVVWFFLYVIRVRKSRLSCNPRYCSYVRWIDILIDFDALESCLSLYHVVKVFSL